MCKLVCPVNAIELGPIADIAQKKIDETTPKILIDHDKCCYCMLCAIICPSDAFSESIEPEKHINLEEYPTIGKFYRIDEKKCLEDLNYHFCQLCLKVRDSNNIKDYVNIQKYCPAHCFFIDSPIKGEVIIKKNMLWKCDPQGCKACINICPTNAFFIPESAEDVKKYGKIACKEDQCFYCGACENSCPDKLIVVKRKDLKIQAPKKEGYYPWIKGWSNNIVEILKKRIVSGKESVEIPAIEQEVKKLNEKMEQEVPQLSAEDRKKFYDLNEKVQKFLKSSKVRYWMKDKKTDKITAELKKILK